MKICAGMRNRTATISHDNKMYHLLCEVCKYHLHHTLLFYVSKTMELSVVCECHDINRFRISNTASIDVP